MRLGIFHLHFLHENRFARHTVIPEFAKSRENYKDF